MIDVPMELVLDWHQTGSTVICDPPVTDTDIDFVIYTDCLHEMLDTLKEKGYNICGDAEYKGEGMFTAVRKGLYNYILTGDEIVYLRYEAAMLLAQKRNLLVKEARVVLFDKIIKGNE